jgi:hypothetical protein
MHRLSLVVLLLGALASLVAAACKYLRAVLLLHLLSTAPADNRHFAAAPTFCKCTCFKQSKIIPLGPQHTDNVRLYEAREAHREAALDPRSASSSCSQCTKAFCISNLGVDICKDATDDDVQTMCFQRDSNKDKIIVWGFILGTSGLLGWAAARRIMEARGAKNQVPDLRGGYGRVDGR